MPDGNAAAHRAAAFFIPNMYPLQDITNVAKVLPV